MGTFDELETATRVREIIKGVAKKQIDLAVPGVLVGRVISMDLPNLKAMIWFTGDEEPIQVNLLSSTLPGDWARRGYPVNAVSTATQGFGSMAVCQRFNGVLYVTDVITGGQFAFNLSTVNLAISEMLADPGTGDIAGDPKRSLMTVRVSGGSSQMADGAAVNFGPFLGNGNDSSTSGNVIAIINDGLCSKRYNFTFSDKTFTDVTGPKYDQWYRIMPDSETGVLTNDWDFDICLRQTVHGLDRGTYQSTEIWFRIINRTGALDFINHSVSFDTDVFVRAQGFDKKFICENVTIPSMPVGYLGFNQPGTPNVPLSQWYAQDVFFRTTATTVGMGTADTGESWFNDNGAGHVTDQSYTNGTNGVMYCSAANTVNVKTISPTVDGSNLTNVEAFVVFNAPVLPVTANTEFGIVLRFVDVSNYYSYSVIFTTAGTMNYNVRKRVAGVDTSLAPGTPAIAFTPGERIGLRAYCVGSLLTISFWRYDAQDEVSGVTTFTGDSSIAGPGRIGLRLSILTGNTNTYPYNINISRFVGGNSGAGKVKSSGAVAFRDGAWPNGRLRLAAAIQKSMFVDSPLNFTSGKISWGSGLIRLGGAGRSRNGLSEGRAYCGLPNNGDVVPIMPNGTFASVSGGIPLSGGQSLWLGIPPGTANRNLKDYLFIIDDNYRGVEMVVPEWAVLIGSVLSDYPTTLVSGFPNRAGVWISLKYTTPGTTAFLKTSYPGLKGVMAHGVGGGASGGSVPATTAAQACAGGGGGGGEYARTWCPYESLANSVNVVVGAGGTAPAVGSNAGLAGGDSSFDVAMIAKGAAAGAEAGVAGATTQSIRGGNPGFGGTGDFLIPGTIGWGAVRISTGPFITQLSSGGSSFWGHGAQPSATDSGNTGTTPLAGYGGGGSGAFAQVSNATGWSGGAGASGAVQLDLFF